eukprot:4493044-Amphidinium_carterae.1
MDEKRPVIVYTDGASEDDYHTFGIVVNDTADGTTWVAGGEVPQRLSEFWKQVVGTQIITQVEMLPVVLLRWECGRELAERRVIYYIDNEPA